MLLVKGVNNSLKHISIDKNKIKIYGMVAILLYILLIVAYIMRGMDGFPPTLLPSVLLMPIAICFIGIMNIDTTHKWIEIVLTVLIFLYMPAHIINFVLGDYEIRLAESFFFNCLMVFAAASALMAIFLNIRAAAAICCIIAFVILTANTFVIAFRGTAVTPADFYALPTAIKVAGGYKYFINISMISSLMYSVILLQLINKFCISLNSITLYIKLVLRAIFAVIAVICFTVTINNIAPLSVGDYNPFDTALSNRRMGTIPVFILNVKEGVMEQPEGYEVESAKSFLDSAAQAEQPKPIKDKPNIIVIMNEAFCDIGKVYDVGESEDPLKYWHSMEDNTISGDMLVSITGGGTSYTEFEFLTGLAGGIIPISKTPYLDYIKSNTNSLAWDLRDEGYTNIAVHPFWSSCWNRGVVYPFLGFDDFISGEDFSKKEKGVKDYNQISDEHIITHTNFGDDLEYIREYISDRESYKKVIEQFENKAKDEKLFVFNVTVQNHSGFDYEGADFREDVKSTIDNKKETNQYLSLLKQSDIAYGELIDYFKNYDEPTIVLMFGDHQPGIPFVSASAGENVAQSYAKYAQDGIGQKFIVPYKLWANYDIPTEQRSMTSAGYLSLLVKDVAGIKYNKWDNFRMEMKSNFAAVTAHGYFTDDSAQAYSSGDTTKDELIKKYELLEYYMLIDKGLTDKSK